jgi:hypothetical protein
MVLMFSGSSFAAGSRRIIRRCGPFAAEAQRRHYYCLGKVPLPDAASASIHSRGLATAHKLHLVAAYRHLPRLNALPFLAFNSNQKS